MSLTQSNASETNDDVQFKRVGYIYDIECMGNTHTATFLDIATQELKVFVVNHLQDDRKEYFEFLNWCCKNAAWCGFNNVGYDYPVVHKIMQQQAKLTHLSAHEAAVAIKKISDEIISTEYSSVREFEIKIPQVDLYLIYHYNNKNKRCSLKQLEFVMQMMNIEDMPFHHTYHLETKEELDILIGYNIHDVKATYTFYKKSLEFTEMRKTLTRMFGFNFINFNDPKIGEQIFLHELSKGLNVSKNDLKDLRNDVKDVNFNDIIIPEITFETKAYQELLKFYKSLTPSVEDIKGLLTDYDLSKPEIKGLRPYLDESVIKQKKVKGNVKKLLASKISVVNHGIAMDYGSGGAHACSNERTIWHANETWGILDIDVDGFYPNLCISRNWSPKHLGSEFIKVYKWLGEERAKYPKKHPLNTAFKLSRNGSYGFY
jgi:hypothetical protein